MFKGHSFHRLTIVTLFVVLSAGAVFSSIVLAEEDEPQVTREDVQGVIDRYAKRREEYLANRRNLPLEERRALRAKLLPQVPEAPSMVEWARGHSDDALALVALRLVLEYSAFEPAAKDAGKVIIANHLDIEGEDFRLTLTAILGTPPDVAEQCLDAYSTHSKSRRTRGLACWSLGIYQAQLVSSAGDLGSSILEVRVQKQLIPYLKELDPGRALAVSERLLKQASEEYGDIEIQTAPGKKITLKVMADNDLARVQREFRTLAIGKMAPKIDGDLLEGETLNLSDFRGKVVVVNFWSTTCLPCMRLIPEERELVRNFKDRPFALLGVNLDAKREVAMKAIEKHEMTWPNWWDDVEGDDRIADNWNIRMLPTIYVIDRQGIIRFKHLRGAELQAAVEGLLKEKQ